MQETDILEKSLILVIEWLFFAYMSYRIGNKLNIKKSYPWYAIPLWNFWVLGKHSEIKLKDFYLLLVMFGFLFIYLIFQYISVYSDSSTISILNGADKETSLFIANRLAGEFFYTFLTFAVLIIKFGVIAIFWGAVARKMGKEFWAYILFSFISIYLPPILLSFDKLNGWMTDSNIFKR